MLKATRDFSHAGIEVFAGQEIELNIFEPDDVQGLISKGLLVDTEATQFHVKSGDALKVSTKRSKTK
ncbi:MAG: hypothetical protein ABIG63_19930 [Chloroflexota bacterium]